MDLAHQLSGGLDALGLELPPGGEARLLAFLDLLQRWNRAYNLTNISDPAGMVTKHLLDSLAVSPFLEGPHIVDVGSGAGLPGIPLAVACPEKHFVLLDANGKKTRFIQQAVMELGLENVEVVRSRCEAYHSTRCFETVLCRAFAQLDEILRLTAHLCCAGGVFLVMKGKLHEIELRCVPPEYGVEKMIALQVPGLAAARHLLCIRRPSLNQTFGQS